MAPIPILLPLAFLLSLFLIHNFRRPAIRLGLVDSFDSRKHHKGKVPLVGGIGLFAAFTLAAPLLEQDLGSYWGLFFGMGILLIAGTLDDLHDIRPRGKILVQALAVSVLLEWGNHQIQHLGIWPEVEILTLGPFALPFTLLCAVGFLNAVNMMDGLDGLCGAAVLVMLGWLMVAAGMGGAPEAAVLPALLAAILVGFLVYNFPHPWRAQASVFLGDAGSLMLGFAVAWFALEVAYQRPGGIPPMTVAWILGLPIFDAIALIFRRALRGQHPMAADREHLHHIFQRAGFTDRETVYFLITMMFVMGGMGILFWSLGLPDWMMFLGLLGAFAGYLWFLLHAQYVVGGLRRWRASGSQVEG